MGLSATVMGERVLVTKSAYVHGGTAVMLIDGEGSPFCTVSVNLPESKALPEGAFYVKHWSENAPVVAALVDQGIIIPVEAPSVSSGLVDNIRAYRLK